MEIHSYPSSFLFSFSIYLGHYLLDIYLLNWTMNSMRSEVRRLVLFYSPVFPEFLYNVCMTHNQYSIKAWAELLKK